MNEKDLNLPGRLVSDMDQVEATAGMLARYLSNLYQGLLEGGIPKNVANEMVKDACHAIIDKLWPRAQIPE